MPRYRAVMMLPAAVEFEAPGDREAHRAARQVAAKQDERVEMPDYPVSSTANTRAKAEARVVSVERVTEGE